MEGHKKQEVPELDKKKFTIKANCKLSIQRTFNYNGQAKISTGQAFFYCLKLFAKMGQNKCMYAIFAMPYQKNKGTLYTKLIVIPKIPNNVMYTKLEIKLDTGL